MVRMLQSFITRYRHAKLLKSDDKEQLAELARLTLALLNEKLTVTCMFSQAENLVTDCTAYCIHRL